MTVTKSGDLTIAAHSDREIIMKRTFNAPCNLVFEAHTKPELLKRWLGVRGGWTLAVCEIDLRVGGRYRYVWRKESKGIDMGAGGVYREIVRPEKWVCTEQFDDPWYPGESLLTSVLDEHNGKTTLTTTMLYESPEARQSPMESGLAESYDMLAELLNGMQK
jgi:uncharacterized protein YndB with AHSA1/START domain